MAVNGQGGFAPVLAALSTMQSNVERPQKTQAHEYLEKFQKSVRFLELVNISFILRHLQKPQAWTTTNSMLSSSEATTEAKLFAATTLKGKVRILPERVSRYHHDILILLDHL